MLNEERIILMSRMSSYEKREGRKNIRIGNYFRSDYVAIQVLKSIISATIAFAVIFGLYILYNMETLMLEMYTMDLFAFAKSILVRYGVTVVAYGVLTYIVSSWRYAMAKRSLKNYYHNLKKLNSLYNEKQQGI